MINLSTMTQLKNQSNFGVKVQGKDLKRLQMVLLEILKDIDDCCKKNGIKYSITGGTTLGAVRHKGFIPWDDDVDLNMFRAEFDKFLPAFQQEYGDKYAIHGPEITPELGMTPTQLSLKDTVYRTTTAPNRDDPGIFIDISPLENTPNNKVLRFLHGFFALAFGLLLSCSRYAKDFQYLENCFENLTPETLKAMRVKVRIGKFISMFISTKKLCTLTNNWHKLCKNSKSRYITVPTGRLHYFGEMAERELFAHTHLTAFEDLTVPMIDDYDTYLRYLYGADYMTPPPENKRETHPILEIDFGKYPLSHILPEEDKQANTQDGVEKS